MKPLACVVGDLSRFRAFIEQRGHETGSWRGDVDSPDRSSPPQVTMPNSPNTQSGDTHRPL